MTFPEPPYRFPTNAAVDSLAARFELENEAWMQDWEFQVADASRLEEFLVVVEGDELNDDERFTLAQIVMQCFDDSASEGQDVAALDQWQRFVRVIRRRPELHAYMLHYWSALETPLEMAAHISRLVRPLWVELQPIADERRDT